MNIAMICKISHLLGELQRIKHNMELEAFHKEAKMIEEVQNKLIERINKITGGQP